MSVIGPRPQLVRDMVFMTPEQRMAKMYTVYIPKYQGDKTNYNIIKVLNRYRAL